MVGLIPISYFLTFISVLFFIPIFLRGREGGRMKEKCEKKKGKQWRKHPLRSPLVLPPRLQGAERNGVMYT